MSVCEQRNAISGWLSVWLWLSLATGLLALAGMVGWTLDIWFLRTIVPWSNPMMPGTAFVLIVASVTSGLLHRGWRKAAVVGSVLTLAGSVLLLCYDLNNFRQMRGIYGADGAPELLATPDAAIALVLWSLATLLLASGSRLQKTAGLLLALTAAVALAGFVGSLTWAHHTMEGIGFAGLAVSSAFGLLLISMSSWSWLMNNAPGSVRQLLVVMIPAAVGTGTVFLMGAATLVLKEKQLDLLASLDARYNTEAEVASEEHQLLEQVSFLARQSESLILSDVLVVLVLLSAAGFLWARSELRRLRTYETLVQSESRFRDAFRNSGIGMAVISLDGRVIEANDALSSFIGYTTETVKGISCHDVTHEDDRAACDFYMAELVEGKNDFFKMEKRYLHAQGHVVWGRMTVSLVRNVHGEPLNYIAQIEDITAFKRSQNALRESEEIQRLFIESAPVAIAMLDCDFRLVSASKRWLVEHELTEDHVRGHSIIEYLPGDSETWVNAMEDCLQGNFRNGELEAFKSDGEQTVWLDWCASPWRRAEGDIGGIVLFSRDRTSRKNLERELEIARDQALEASRLKSQFLASMSHEIRTPMNGIIGMTELLRESGLTEDQLEMNGVVLTCADNLLVLINDILDLSKIEAGRMEIEHTEFDLLDLVDETIALLETRASAKGLELNTEIEWSPDVALLGDPTRIRQVLMNLLGNAIKFTRQGQVCVRLRQTSADDVHASFRCEVEDTGIGIAWEAQKHIFEPFVQADSECARRCGGTGLGLSISRQLIDLMGGRIGFRSEPGKGSVFFFELTLEKPQQTPPMIVEHDDSRSTVSVPADAVPSDTADEPEILTGHLLVAEDNRMNQLVIRRMLERIGFQLTTVPDGKAALAALESGTFDAVLMDCQMPVMDGFEATRRIRAGEAGEAASAIPIIALTAHALEGDRERCFGVGMNEFIAKPLKLNELNRALRACMGPREATSLA